jgi:pimeloyl-ACP methyl ester carboxylesterase
MISSAVISRDGTRIAYDRSGSGPALVIVAGALQFRGSDPRTSQLIDRLGRTSTVIFYDRRGRGDSTDNASYAVEREVEDLGAIIEGPGGGHAALLGMSSGGLLAIEAAASGLPVSKLAVYEPPVIVDDSAPGIPQDYARRVEELLTRGDVDEAVAYFFTAPLGDQPGPVKSAITSDPSWPALRRVASTIAYDARLMMRAWEGGRLPAERWRTVTAPVLVMRGTASFPFVAAAAEAITSALPHAELQVLSGQGHDPDPDAIAPLIEQFVSSK